MRVCSVETCENRSVPKAKSYVKVHLVPKDKSVADQWIKAIPSLAKVKVKSPAVCSRHFSEKDYSSKTRQYLRPTAVPSLNLNGPSSAATNESCKNIKHERLLKRIQSLKEANEALQVECRRQRTLLGRSDRSSGKTKSSLAHELLQDCNGSFHIGKTQLSILLMTDEHEWSKEEIEKASELKKITTPSCYSFISSNLMPLPSHSDVPGEALNEVEQANPDARVVFPEDQRQMTILTTDGQRYYSADGQCIKFVFIEEKSC